MDASNARTAFVTGAASGIGRRLTGALAARGWRVAAADIQEETLAAAREQERWPEDKVRLLKLDVTRAGDWDAALDGLDNLKAVIHSAGYLKPGPLAQASGEDALRHIGVNALGTILGTLAAARRLGPGGHVVCLGSLAALMPVPGIALYSASKHAVRAFALAAAEELAQDGIAVTVLCPGPVRTPMLEAQLDSPQAALTFAAAVFEPDEIVAAVLAALERRPLEVRLPLSQGLLASLVNAFPRLWRLCLPVLRRQGLRNQAAMRRAFEAA